MKRIFGAVLCVLLSSCLVWSGAQAANYSAAYYANLLKEMREKQNNALTIGGKTYNRDGFTALKRGDKGDLVKAVQRRLIELDYLMDSADGVYGSNTEGAVILFQAAMSLQRSGTLDFDALKQLMDDDAPYYVEDDFCLTFANYAKWNTKGNYDMTFQVQIHNGARSHTVKKVGLYIMGKNSDGDVMSSNMFTEEVSVKIKPGQTAYTPKMNLNDRRQVRKVACALAWVEFTDGCTAYPENDADYWTWTITW